VSYEISLLLARKKKFILRQKVYSTAEEIVKPCLNFFIETVGDPNILRMVDDIALSRNTVMRRIDEMADDVNKQIFQRMTECFYFSLALDESCDVSDTAQLCIYMRCVNEEFDITKELLDIRQLISSKGEDVFRETKDVIDNRQLNWDKLDSVCTDGAPAMIGKVKGFVKFVGKVFKTQSF
jgi:hypothetical protein